MKWRWSWELSWSLAIFDFDLWLIRTRQGKIRPTVLQCQAQLSKKVVLSFLNPFPEVKVVPPTI